MHNISIAKLSRESWFGKSLQRPGRIAGFCMALLRWTSGDEAQYQAELHCMKIIFKGGICIHLCHLLQSIALLHSAHGKADKPSVKPFHFCRSKFMHKNILSRLLE
jgi:hypothetical protein